MSDLTEKTALFENFLQEVHGFDPSVAVRVAELWASSTHWRKVFAASEYLLMQEQQEEVDRIGIPDDDRFPEDDYFTESR